MESEWRVARRKERGRCRAETLLFIRAIICQPGVAGILFKTSRAYITCASEKEGGEERGGRRSMAGFYYRDHLFVNIIYTLWGGGSVR